MTPLLKTTLFIME